MPSPPGKNMERRDALAAIALSITGHFVLASSTGCTAPQQKPGDAPQPSPEPKGSAMPLSFSPTLSGKHSPIPLPFKPGALSGISERLIVSHHENNYGGAVKNLNKVEQELSRINADTPPLVVTALRERELTFRNSKTLHELYFANLGGNGRITGGVEAALAQAYGSTATWEAHFRATGLGLGGGSGWVILAYELDSGSLRTFGSGNHSQAPALALPLLVMDMYEHSYQMDYGAAHPRYIDAFFSNIHWEEVNRRLEQAGKLRSLFSVLP